MATTFVRVGELACQQNSLLQQLTAAVVSCEPAIAAASPTGKKNKSPSTTTTTTEQQMFDVVLSDSVLFPEGGGQPCDHGTLFIGGNDNDSKDDGIPITSVVRRGNTCVLASPTALTPGTTVLQRVDWHRRVDHMHHHTAQHLLTAVVERADMMCLPTVSWSLTHPFCFIVLDVAEYTKKDNKDTDSNPYAKYITPEKKICDEMVRKIQDACNAAIAGSTAVRCDVFESREAYQAEAERKEREEEGGRGRFRSRGIPADVSGPIRIITLDEVDSCTCCGTHCGSLSELQTLQLLHQETKGTTVKLFFVTGARAVEQFGAMYGRERQLMTALAGSRPEDFAEVVGRRSKEAGEAEKKMKRWGHELAGYEAQRMIGEINAHQKKVAVIRRDDMEMDFFNAVRAALNDAGLASLVLVAAWATDSPAAAATATIVPTRDVQGQLFISGGDAEAVQRVTDTAKAVMTGVKGGLSKMGFRGKGSLREWTQLVEAVDSLEL